MGYPYVISGSKLRKLLACERLPYMDAFADPAASVERKSYLAVDLGIIDEVDVAQRHLVRKLTPHRGKEKAEPSRPSRARNRPPGQQAPNPLLWTQVQMQKGTKVIEHGLVQSKSRITGDLCGWFGSPAFLEKCRGLSTFGRWYYRPGSRRRSPKESFLSHAIPLTYYALILEQVQGFRPPEFTIHDAYTGQEEAYPVSPHVPEAIELISRLENLLLGKADPGPRLKSDCANCQWREACRSRAEEIKHLTLLSCLAKTGPGVPRKLILSGSHGERRCERAGSPRKRWSGSSARQTARRSEMWPRSTA